MKMHWCALIAKTLGTMLTDNSSSVQVAIQSSNQEIWQGQRWLISTELWSTVLTKNVKIKTYLLPWKNSRIISAVMMCSLNLVLRNVERFWTQLKMGLLIMKLAKNQRYVVSCALVQFQELKLTIIYLFKLSLLN